MRRVFESAGKRFIVRPWQADDDRMLRDLMKAHMDVDLNWPPNYARETDLAEWLGSVAGKGRWVVEREDGTVVGHGGLGDVKPGPLYDALQTALKCQPEEIVEICRIVVHPDARGHGLAGELTRVCLRAAIEAGLYPVSNVTTNRGSWLEMMLSTGWREISRVRSRLSKGDIVAMLPPQKFIDAVLQSRSG